MISSELKRFLGIVQSPRHKSMNFGSGPEISGQLTVDTWKKDKRMWIFGYGSLMSGAWESPFGCERRTKAELHGYRRAFNKGSVRNWGTKSFPCPTLNLIADPKASCLGIAFQFPEQRQADVEAHLAEREGKNFALAALMITIDEQQVPAMSPIYTGPALEIQAIEEMIAGIRRATGTNGSCFDYFANVYAELCKLGIDDPVVSRLWRSLQI
ncbi:gamma-glutamylcyclotransferase [Dyella sp. 7MK23]|uniref:glutathione-specific gamma-glutamylcyclotransferase n=2 Tax=Dyella acidiphila TaxID=2775866 RepID=A0ABR9GG52_9GAMM|nr:gamma-glutamylcyclotransferase [Dyella acidiphila]